jgi:hypothetical protein
MTSISMFKRSLNALGMSGKDFAELHTQSRTDGMKTTNATVSRWVNGGHVEAGVQMFLREKLFQLARSTPPKVGDCKIVAFGGGKGGSGTTSIAIVLAATVRSMGYTVQLGCSHETVESNQFICKLHNSPTQFEGLDLSNLRQHKSERKENYDFIFLDIGNKTLVSEQTAEQIDLESIDLVVTPCNPFHPKDMHPAWKVAKTLTDLHYEHFLLLPFVNRIDIAVGADSRANKDAHLVEQYAHRFCNTSIFCRSGFEKDVDLRSRRQSWGEILDRDMWDQYWSLYYEIMHSLGAEADDLEINEDQLSQMNTESLLTYLKY